MLTIKSDWRVKPALDLMIAAEPNTSSHLT